MSNSATQMVQNLEALGVLAASHCVTVALGYKPFHNYVLMAGQHGIAVIDVSAILTASDFFLQPDLTNFRSLMFVDSNGGFVVVGCSEFGEVISITVQFHSE